MTAIDIAELEFLFNKLLNDGKLVCFVDGCGGFESCVWTIEPNEKDRDVLYQAMMTPPPCRCTTYH